jgi:hypothetical protein
VEMGTNRLETVVARQSPTELQLHAPDRKIELIVHHHQPAVLDDAVLLGQRSDGAPGLVVERRWLGDDDTTIADSQHVGLGVIPSPAAKLAAVTPNELVDDPEAGVMTRLGVVVTGVAKADHEEVGRRSGSFAVGPPDHRRSARGSVLVAAGVGLGVTVGTRLSFGAVSGFALLGPANRFTS